FTAATATDFVYLGSSARMPFPQALKTHCGANCGKVLIRNTSGAGWAYAYFDPNVSGPTAFSAAVQSPDPAFASTAGLGTTTLLPDGRMLLTGGPNEFPSEAALMDPATGTVTADTTAPYSEGSANTNSPTQVLPTGQV